MKITPISSLFFAALAAASIVKRQSSPPVPARFNLSPMASRSAPAVFSNVTAAPSELIFDSANATQAVFLAELAAQRVVFYHDAATLLALVPTAPGTVPEYKAVIGGEGVVDTGAALSDRFTVAYYEEQRLWALFWDADYEKKWLVCQTANGASGTLFWGSVPQAGDRSECIYPKPGDVKPLEALALVPQ